MSKKWKAICLVVAVALVLALGAVLAPSILTSLGVTMAISEPPPPPPPPPAPVAGFSGQPTMGEAPLTVQFTDRSSDSNIVSWMWDFGDGQTSSQRYPSHTYYTEGLYRTSLTVTNEEGRTGTHYMADYVIVDAGAAPAGLSVRNLRIEPTYVQPNQPVAIYADVVNKGGGWGSPTVHLVINGYVEQSREVGVSPGTAYPLSFAVYKAVPGTYAVAIGGATGLFYVTQEQ